MPGITLQFFGFNRVKNNLRTIASNIPSASDKFIQEFVKKGRRILKAEKYPPKRSGQTYVRTGNLANRWATRKISVGRWAVINTAPYASYVVGVDQAWMHIKRWWIAKKVLAKHSPELALVLADEYMKLLTKGVSK